MDLGVLLLELAMLNSNVKVLTEVMVFNLKQTQDKIQYQSKVDGDKTLTLSTPDAKTWKTSPYGSLSPSTKHSGLHKGNKSWANSSQVTEHTRSNIRLQSGI